MKFRIVPVWKISVSQRQAKKLNHGCHLWACYQCIQIGPIQVGWLSFAASKKYYEGGFELKNDELTRFQFSKGLTKSNWKM